MYATCTELKMRQQMCRSFRPVITGNAENLIGEGSHAMCYSKLKHGVGKLEE